MMSKIKSYQQFKHILKTTFLMLLLWNTFAGLSFAMGRISGKVIDAKSEHPLSGANIQVLRTLFGASTDGAGHFLIEQVPPGVYLLRISMMGYRSVILKGVQVRDKEQVDLLVKLTQAPIEFDPIIVSASRTRQRLDQSPVSVSVVTAKEIKQRHPVNLIEALETVPGINFIGDQINIRGSTGFTFGVGNKVLLLLDGIPVYASDTGEFNWDMLPPLDIEQIEILKGAGSTLWGASALGGVVNIITKSPSAKSKLLFSLNYGKYDKPFYKEWYWTDQDRLHFFRTDVSFSKRIRSLGMRISAGRFTSTGYRQLGDFKKYNLTGKFDYRFRNDMKWTVYAAYSFIDRGFFVQWKGQNDPYQVDEANLDNYAQTNQLNFYAKLAVPVSSTFGLNFRASVVRTLMGDQFGEGGDFNPAFGQGLEFQGDWFPHPEHQITFGVQYQLDAGSTKFFGDHQGYFIGPYVQNEWRVRENLRMTAGLRYDRYQLVGGLKEDLFSPRLGINWQPRAATTFRLSAGSGFRAATIVERFLELSIMNFNIIANPRLKAESSWAYDVGVRHYFTRDWNVDISLFDNEYKNLIEAHLDLIRGQIQFRNIPRARIQGIEATTNMGFPLRVIGLKLTSQFHASVTALNHKDLKWNEPLAYRPRLLAKLKWSCRLGSAQLQVNYRYASKIEEVKIYPINERVAMKFLDVRFSYELGNLTCQFGINNLLQYNYAPMESNLMPMRTFTFGLQGDF